MAFQCPKCELLFSSRTELETHVATDHTSLDPPSEQTAEEDPESDHEAEPAPTPPPKAPKDRRGFLARVLGREKS